MNNYTREICLEKVDTMIESVRRASDSCDLVLHLTNRAEGFILGLFYADIINEEEFKTFNKILDKAFFHIDE